MAPEPECPPPQRLPAMPSFDVVSRTDMAEVDNAVHGAAREIDRRLRFLLKRIEVLRIVYEEG